MHARYEERCSKRPTALPDSRRVHPLLLDDRIRCGHLERPDRPDNRFTYTGNQAPTGAYKRTQGVISESSAERSQQILTERTLLTAFRASAWVSRADGRSC